jgi:ATP-dependent DNA ligase
MFKAFEFCIPTRGTKVPSSPDWFHEIKYDGYRLRVERDGDRVRLITRGGYDWTKRYPWIVESALKNRYKQFVIDGEAVILGVDGISDFNALHSGKHNDEVQLYAFDILALNGDDLRSLPLSMRKAHLERLLARRPDGIVAQNLGQRIGKSSWLGELEDVSVGHGVSLLRWRSGRLRTPPRYAALPLHAVTNFRP